jgi:hypothetical protein
MNPLTDWNRMNRFEQGYWTAVAVIVLGYAIGGIYETYRDLQWQLETTAYDDWDPCEQSHKLQENHLERLEGGDHVTIPRWHGCDLVLSGEVVVDAEEVEAGDEE